MFKRINLWKAGAFVGSASALVGSAFAEGPALGVYIWGDNQHGLIDTNDGNLSIKTPTRVPFLDGQKLRDLSLSSMVAAAVLKNGSVVQWTHPESHDVVLKGKSVRKVKVANDTIVALSSGGDVWSWTKDDKKPSKFKVNDGLGWFEKIVEIDAGDDHVACLTSKGRVLTGMLRQSEAHNGQLGQASFSAFDPPPRPFELRLVKLIPERVVQVACGASTTLFRTTSGDLYGCGSNAYGQLMLPFTFKNVKVSVPTKATTRLNGGLGRVTNVAAGGEVTYLQTEDKCFVVGNGITGQFGTGSLAHCQAEPLQMPLLTGLQEFNERLGKVETASPDQWSVSATHTFVKLTGESGSWFVWGNNAKGELGTGKNAKLIKPTLVGQLDNINAHSCGNTFVAGNSVSGCFTTCT